MAYQSLKRNNSSSSPAHQPARENPFAPRPYNLQPEPEQEATAQPEPYSREAYDLIASRIFPTVNPTPAVQKQAAPQPPASEREPEKDEQQSELEKAGKISATANPEQPNNNKFNSSNENRPIQTKLTIGEPGDKYEQEADAIATQVMSMPNAPQPAITHHNHSDRPANQINRKPTPSLVQRHFAAKLQQRRETQKSEPSSNTPSTSNLENTLASKKGSGNALDEQTRTFMEDRFGTDFSSVRVHTDTTAVQMNKELGAQAFTHGSDIFYGAGKSPGQNELTAHELTHVVQQTGVKTLRKKPATVALSNKESLGTKHSEINLKSDLVKKTKENQQWQLDNKENYLNQDTITKFSQFENSSPNIQAKCATCAKEEKVQRKPEIDNKVLSSQSKFTVDDSSPKIQAKCATCAKEEEKVQRQPVVENKISYSESKSTVQAFGFEDIGNAFSSGAQWVGNKVGEVASLGADAFAGLVARVAPGLATLISQGPMGLLTEKIQEGIKGWVSGLTAGVDIGGIVAGLQNSFTGIFAAVQALGNGDAASCAAFAQSIKSLQELGEAFMNNPVFQQIQAAFSTVSGIFQKVTNLVVAPAFDALMGVAGSIFNGVKNLATTIWEWGAPVRNTLGAAWDWVKGQLGFGGDGEGGIFEWLKTKASEAWNQIKTTLAPVMGPLQAVGGTLLAFTPVGQIYLVIKYVPQLVQAGQWLWANKDNPDIVKTAHEQMGNTILPGLLSGVQGFSQTLQSAVTGLVNQAVSLGESLLGLLGAVSGVPLLSMAQNLVQTVSNGVKDFISWCQTGFQSAAESVQSFFTAMAEKVKPYMGVLTSLGMAIVNPGMIPVILAGSAWQALDDCYKAPIINFLLDIVIGLLESAPSLPMFGLLWSMIKAGVIGFLQGVRGKPDNEKVAITNKLAKIISGGSPAFILGFVKGLLKGIWEGLTDPFVLIYEAIKGLSNLVTWLNDVATQALSPTPAAETPRTTPAGETSPAATTTTNNQNVEMGQRMREMAGELEPPVQQVGQGFMPAMQEVFSSGGGMSFEQLMQKLGDAWAGVETAIRNAGSTLADKVCEFLLQDKAEGEMGEAVGWLAGTIAFEVVLGILTAGSWTAAKGAMKGIKLFAKVLDWTSEAMGLAFRGLAKVGGFILDGIKGLGKLLSNAGGAAKGILDALGEIGQKLTSFADELLSRFGKKASGEVAEENIEQVAKETVEETGERLAIEIMEETSERGGRELAEETSERGSREASEEAGERGRHDAANEATEKPVAISAAKTIITTQDPLDTPVPILVGMLNGLKSEYSWIERFEARPQGRIGEYSIHMIASDTDLGKYTTRLPRSNGSWTGTEGDSEWNSTIPEVNAITGGQPIPFKDGYPDFSTWADKQVEIPNMTGKNSQDFRAADKVLAEQMGWLKKNGKPNGADAQRYRETNNLTWHHVQDGKNMQLVPTSLHENIPHIGGASLSRDG